MHIHHMRIYPLPSPPTPTPSIYERQGFPRRADGMPRSFGLACVMGQAAVFERVLYPERLSPPFFWFICHFTFLPLPRLLLLLLAARSFFTSLLVTEVSN